MAALSYNVPGYCTYSDATPTVTMAINSFVSDANWMWDVCFPPVPSKYFKAPATVAKRCILRQIATKCRPLRHIATAPSRLQMGRQKRKMRVQSLI